MISAIILGGGTLKGLEEATLTKALIKIDKKPMIEYVVDALKESPSIDRIVALVPADARSESWVSKVDDVLLAGDFIGNIRAGLNNLPSKNEPASKVFLTSCDIPLVSSEAIEDFISRCHREEAEIYYAIIPKDVIMAKYPETKRTYVTLREGTFTGGNVSLVSPVALKKNFGLLEKAYNLRKSPFKLAKTLGFNFIIKFIFRSLSLTDAEKRVTDLLNARGKAIVTPYPEIGIDVDKQADLELVQKIIRRMKSEDRRTKKEKREAKVRQTNLRRR
jgi:molybdopterin-guanine dinucleotide biosynthesis protein A